MRISDWSSDVCSSDLAGTDDGNARTGRHPAAEYVEIAQRLGVVGAGETGVAWGDAGGDHHLIEVGQIGGGDTMPEADIHSGVAQAGAEVAQGFVELFLAGGAFGGVEQIGRASGRERGG